MTLKIDFIQYYITEYLAKYCVYHFNKLML